MAKSNGTKTIINAIVIAAVVALPIGILVFPSLLRTRMHQLESVENASVRTVITSAMTYKNAHGRYPTDLRELANEGLIDKQLASGQKAGYTFSLRSTSDNFFVLAGPAQPDDLKVSLCADQSGIVHYGPGPGQECTLQSPVLK